MIFMQLMLQVGVLPGGHQGTVTRSNAPFVMLLKNELTYVCIVFIRCGFVYDAIGSLERWQGEGREVGREGGSERGREWYRRSERRRRRKKRN